MGHPARPCTGSRTCSTYPSGLTAGPGHLLPLAWPSAPCPALWELGRPSPPQGSGPALHFRSLWANGIFWPGLWDDSI